ncbi:UDP-glucose 4-epimerase GalE [Solemya velesiana gill symbiont]|uniref:UDP-glucose 4-epimerase n=1 Tax=Solemya velesiana gill symbiont TaxID=1918948 RepID=A0A1T2KSR0_9GAMM|nr:UDP-glucose 4-epimerase GalE [Solemya velesiana gill symbiont]OOZ35895.1 UDP-glucose 4-epimerase GalE [Solemya velesiana gill symbiont]
MRILVCGGAGYIGSHMVKLLARQGHEVVTFDNLSTGHSAAVKWGELVHGDLLNPSDLSSLFQGDAFDVVMHFSARSLVGESIQKPALYYQNNVVGTYNLLEAMRNHGVDKFIFSSSAAIFGNPVKERIDEDHPKAPINPYGKTKLMVEQILQDYAASYGTSSVSLRYFNAAGADAERELGEEHDPETHLIPNILKAAYGQQENTLKIFGDDYDTADGTCVRDYIHVEDLCDAHLKAVEYLLAEKRGAEAFNLGNGNGFSVKEVLLSAQEVVGKEIPYQVDDRKPGDPAVLIADSAKARRELGWTSRYTEISDIISTAWAWMNRD